MLRCWLAALAPSPDPSLKREGRDYWLLSYAKLPEDEGEFLGRFLEAFEAA